MRVSALRLVINPLTVVSSCPKTKTDEAQKDNAQAMNKIILLMTDTPPSMRSHKTYRCLQSACTGRSASRESRRIAVEVVQMKVLAGHPYARLIAMTESSTLNPPKWMFQVPTLQLRNSFQSGLRRRTGGGLYYLLGPFPL